MICGCHSRSPPSIGYFVVFNHSVMINTDSRISDISSSTCGDAQCMFRLACNRPRLLFCVVTRAVYCWGFCFACSWPLAALPRTPRPGSPYASPVAPREVRHREYPPLVGISLSHHEIVITSFSLTVSFFGSNAMPTPLGSCYPPFSGVA